MKTEQDLTIDGIEKLVAFRRQMHAAPELSGEEHQTADAMIEELKKCKPAEIIQGLGGTGILARFVGSKDGPVILVRAELDALPIEEDSNASYRSKKPGVGHLCGHDGHMTMLLGLAQDLSRDPIEKGEVHLLFQPAEEVGRGAEAVLSDNQFVSKPDYVFALHNLPGYPKHSIVVRDGSFTASVISVVYQLKGKTSHAAEPEYGLNPAQAIAEIIKESHFLTLNEPGRDDFSVVVPIYTRLGEPAYGTSPGDGELHFTLRTWSEKQLQLLLTELNTVARAAAEKHGLRLSIDTTDHFRANKNDKTANEWVRQAAEELELDLQSREYPFKWGEDFGLFTQKYKGAMFGLGSGLSHAGLHNPDYDFPDELIGTGVLMFRTIINRIQNK